MNSGSQNRKEIVKILAAIIARDLGWPSAEMASIVYRRLISFNRRHQIESPTSEQRAIDLMKGLRDRYEPVVPYTSEGDWLSLCNPLVAAFIRMSG